LAFGCSPIKTIWRSWGSAQATITKVRKRTQASRALCLSRTIGVCDSASRLRLDTRQAALFQLRSKIYHDWRKIMSHPDFDSPRNRPRDMIDFVEKHCGENGSFQAVDESYYEEFLRLSHTEVERLVVSMMLDQEEEVRRIAHGHSGTTAVAKVSEFICSGLKIISIGLMRFDVFGRVGMCARIGSEPDDQANEALERKLEQMEPIVADEVARSLPWLLSRDGGQGRLRI
jgi:hypothetical protein